MQRTGRCSIDLKCDREGLDQLLAALAFITEKRKVEVEFDRRIINRKTTKIESRKMIFMLDSNPDRFGEICDVDDQIIWIFGTEDYEYAVMLLADVKMKAVSILPSFWTSSRRISRTVFIVN